MAKNEKKEEDKKGGKGSKIIIILLIVIILALAGAVAYFAVFAKKGNTTTHTNQVQQTAVQSSEEATYTFEEILTNLADQDAQRYIKVKVSLGYDSSNSKLKSELEDAKEDIKAPILEAEIVKILRNQKAADFYDQKKVEDIKKQILDNVNPHLKNGVISNVYFSELLIQ